jgi:hypothetical protein
LFAVIAPVFAPFLAFLEETDIASAARDQAEEARFSTSPECNGA